MLKRLLTASIFMLFGASLVMAAGEQKFKMMGEYSAGYKMQNDWKNPWDADGQDLEGSANRSKQTVLQQFKLTLLAMTMADGSIAYPEWMVYAQIVADPNKPDNDGVDEEDVSVGEAFLLWKPHAAINIKIGRQTLPQTYNGGHSFWGAPEFALIKAATVTTKSAGLTVGAYLGSPNHQAGISMVNRGPKITDLYAKFEAPNEKDEGGAPNQVIWYEGKMLDDALKIVFAQQTIQSLESHKANSDIRDSDPESEHDQYGDYLKHTIMNLGVSYDMGFIAPYLGYWKSSGEAPNYPFPGNTTEFEITGTTIGFEMDDLGPGQLAFEYSTLSTPAFGEDKSGAPIIDLKAALSLEYSIEMKKNITLKVTHSQMMTGDTFSEGGEGRVAYGDLADRMDWSATSMTGISFNYKFGQ